jgi:hypothetical protein
MSKKFPGGFISKNPVAPTNAAAKGVWSLTQAANYTKQGIWPKSPGAPTIGTATAVTSTTATVTYTAPTNLGAGTVTYTATSSPGGLTGTGASPITVSGLTDGTSYTFTVTAATPGGTGLASAASNSITTPLAPPTVIGQAYGGGYYAGQIGVGGVATHYLVVGPLASAENSSLAWKNANTATTGADSVIDGPQNTADMVAGGSSTVYPAAHFCNDVTSGGYTDWYLPAKNELEVCYYNLKPEIQDNDTSTGTNTSAVPSRGSNYTTGTPAQTSVTAFQHGNTQAFALTSFWTSTEESATSAFNQNFWYGKQDFDSKVNGPRVRAVRRVPV